MGIGMDNGIIDATIEQFNHYILITIDMCIS